MFNDVLSSTEIHSKSVKVLALSYINNPSQHRDQIKKPYCLMCPKFMWTNNLNAHCS